MRIATFNLQNLRLRTRDGRPVLDGAADQDQPGILRPTDLARADRIETAKVIARAEADIIALQEVFDLATLDFFHDRFLREAGAPDYPYRYCLKGNDGRGLNVAALSRRQPIHVRSHASLTGADLGLANIPAELRNHPIFRRDCLELEFQAITLFACHFKAPYPDKERASIVREAEARAVRKIVEARFEHPERERWIILGDFNEPARADEDFQSALEPIKSGFGIDLLDRMALGTDWTYELPGTHLHSRPDRIFVSPKLAEEYPDVCPQIVRTGMRASRHDFEEVRATISESAPTASDHALVYADFPGLN